MEISNGGQSDDFEYDVCLTFAGEQRTYVEEVARELKARQIRVFFDDYERADMWGKDLYEHLGFIYSRAARYCVLFASKEYAEKVWPSHERRNAQERALEAHGEYVLPARFDDTEIPGLRKTIKYEDLRELTPQELADLIEQKIGPRQKTNFLPPTPDRLYEALDISEAEQEAVLRRAHVFFTTLQRMSDEERQVLYEFVSYACHAELPDNLHMSEDLLRRITDIPSAELRRILAGIHSLGFSCHTREEDAHGHKNELEADDRMLVLEWHAMISASPADSVSDLEIAIAMIRVARDPYCQFHAEKAFMELNFTGLSTATFDPDGH